jgi:hypothetical protein
VRQFLGRPQWFDSQNRRLIPSAQSLAICSAWTRAARPAELHVWQKGGHGFGMRMQRLPVDDWTMPFEAWLRSNGWLVAGK